MQTPSPVEELGDDQKPPTARRRWWLVAVIAAVGLTAAVLVATAVFSGGDEDPATQVAEDAIAVWFAHDVDAYFGYFQDAGTYTGAPITQDARDDAEFYMDLGDTIVSSDQCESTTSVRCHIVSEDDLSGPVGLTWDATWVFWIEEGEITQMYWTGERRPNKDNFINDMIKWVKDTHPDVWESSFALAEPCEGAYNCRGDWVTTPETAVVLLELGADFIADSQKYELVDR